MKKLKRTVQCAKCPWRKDVNPHDIPNGYSVDKHRALEGTIAKDPLSQISTISQPMRVMACHETENAHCIGWLMNQLGPGNNILLRLKMRQYDLSKVRLIGEQHEKFEETLRD